MFPFPLLVFKVFIINYNKNVIQQCSEICGTLHGFMPIKVEALNLYDYLVWLNSSLFIPFLILGNRSSQNT